MAGKKTGGRAVFLDRDGTILRDRHFLAHPDHIDIYPGVIPALKALRAGGWRLIIGTNQSGIGRGYFTEATLHKVHGRLLSIFRRNRLQIDEILFCPHHPEAGCRCRKPQLGMLRKAARKYGLDLSRCVVVGDKESDVLWGRRGGAKSVLVLTGSGRKVLKRGKARPDHVARSLPYAAKWILQHASNAN